jgi:hypothetical protein
MMGTQFKGMNKTVAWLFPIVCSLIFSSLACAATNEDCMQCHSDEKMTTKRKGQTVSLYVDLKKFSRSVHKQAGCAGCHSDADVKEFPHPEKLEPVKCGNCHGDPDKDFNTSIHGKALAKGTLRPTCSSVTEPPFTPEESQPHLQMNIRQLQECHREGAPVARTYDIPEKNILATIPRAFTGGIVQANSSSPPHATTATGSLILPTLTPGRPFSYSIAKTCQVCHTKIGQVP